MHKMPRVVLDAPKTPGPKITSDSRTAIKLHAVTFEKPFSLNVQTYKMDCYFRQSWVDRRLSFTAHAYREHQLPGQDVETGHALF